MNFTVRYTARAEEDIFRNAAWWAKHHSLEQALQWEAAIEQQIATLSEMPERHSLAPENPKFTFDIRQKLVGLGARKSYRAVYTIRETEVIVLAVCRGAQDELSAADLLGD